MTTVRVLSVLLATLAGTAVHSARAQTPDDIQAAIQAEAGPLGLAPCLDALWQRENPGGDPHQLNLEGSGAEGEFQIMPATWASTPTGQTVALAVASVAQQVQAAVELIMGGWISAWSPLPMPACAGA